METQETRPFKEQIPRIIRPEIASRLVSNESSCSLLSEDVPEDEIWIEIVRDMQGNLTVTKILKQPEMTFDLVFLKILSFHMKEKVNLMQKRLRKSHLKCFSKDFFLSLSLSHFHNCQVCYLGLAVFWLSFSSLSALS